MAVLSIKPPHVTELLMLILPHSAASRPWQHDRLWVLFLTAVFFLTSIKTSFFLDKEGRKGGMIDKELRKAKSVALTLNGQSL